MMRRMKPPVFEYHRPGTVAEALAVLAEVGHDGKVLAGGQSLVPLLNMRLAAPRHLVDVNWLAELDEVGCGPDAVRVGALARHARVEHDRDATAAIPLLGQAIGDIAHATVRNRGTVVGSLVHADPAADWPAAILALDAELELAGPRGRRTIPIDSFFVDLLQTALAPDEMLCEIRVPITAKTVAYEKTEQKASGFAIAGVAAVVEKGGAVRVGITGVAAKAYRAKAVERALTGQTAPSADAIARAASQAADKVDALGDIHASADFRRHLAEINTIRALTRAYSVR